MGISKKVFFYKEKARLNYFLFSFAFFFFFSCLVIQMASSLRAQDVRPEPDWPKKITLGFVPYIEPEKVVEKYQPLIEHLEKTLGLKLETIVPDNYIKIIAAMKTRKIEFAYFGPLSYVQAHRQTGAEVLALELNEDGNPGYHALIIASRAGGIQSMDQAQGKVLAFTDPDSASGYLVPLVYFIRTRKQTPASFASRIVFAGSHMAVVKGVAKGEFDVGATNTKDLVRSSSALGLSPDQFNVLWKSELVPGSPIAARKDIPNSLKKAFLDALTSFNQNKATLEKMHVGGYIPAKDTDYDLIRELESMKSK